MKYFGDFNSGSFEEIQEEIAESLTIDTHAISNSKVKVAYADKPQNSSANLLSSCSFYLSGSVMPEKPSMLQETLLSSEKWFGRALEIDSDSLIIDVRNGRNPQNRLKLRVKKDIVEGDLERLNERTNVVVFYARIRNFQGEIEKRISVRLREPAEIPNDILESEFEARMKLYSYMF